MMRACHVLLPFACRSGTEEEYSELHQLLEDISSYLKDFNAVRVAQAAERASQLKKAEEDKRKGEEMRRAAMEGRSSESTDCFMFNSLCVCLSSLLDLLYREETIRRKSSNTTKFRKVLYPFCGIRRWKC